MFFLFMFMFLCEIVFCSESVIDITFQSTSGQSYPIGYLDEDNDKVQKAWQPFNINFKKIELTAAKEAKEISSSVNAYLHSIKRNDQDYTVIDFSCREKFSNIAEIFSHTNLDKNQKKYVSEILEAAEDL